jgi:hypothetical protein
MNTEQRQKAVIEIMDRNSRGDYVFYEDEGHAWLEVTRHELWQLGILSQISRYSYENDGIVYLEEDCDAPKFIEAKKRLEQNMNFKTKFKSGYSFVRSFNHFGG